MLYIFVQYIFFVHYFPRNASRLMVFVGSVGRVALVRHRGSSFCVHAGDLRSSSSNILLSSTCAFSRYHRIFYRHCWSIYLWIFKIFAAVPAVRARASHHRPHRDNASNISFSQFWFCWIWFLANRHEKYRALCWSLLLFAGDRWAGRRWAVGGGGAGTRWYMKILTMLI